MKKQKRVYTKPEMETIKIDTEISIVMMTTPPPDPDSKIVNQAWEKEKAKKEKESFSSPFE